jgi:ABC-type bacteriocin/lantibiotic exporter with double-glycine peptidase domain
MLQTTHSESVQPLAQMGAMNGFNSDSFFFPGQFAAKPSLQTLGELLKAHGGSLSGAHLAEALGLGAEGRLGVQDLMLGAELAGLKAEVRQCRPEDLKHLALPALAFVRDSEYSGAVLLLTQCDGRYVATQNFASGAPLSVLGPLRVLTEVWAKGGRGWVMSIPAPN